MHSLIITINITAYFQTSFSFFATLYLLSGYNMNGYKIILNIETKCFKSNLVI